MPDPTYKVEVPCCIAADAELLLQAQEYAGKPHADFEGFLNSTNIPSEVIGRITAKPELPAMKLQWYWQTNGLEFISANHTAWVIYDDHGRNDKSKTIQSAPSLSSSPTSSSISLLATLDFGSDIQGGTLIAKCSVHFRNPQTGQMGDTGLGEQRLSIRGDNPTKALVKSLLREVPLQVIAFMESRFQQFDNTGLPLFGPPHGFGVMQLDNPSPSARQVWDWRQNITGGMTLYQRKKREVAQHFQNIYSKNPSAPKLLEEQQHTSLYQYYNGGFYWDWDPKEKQWIKAGTTAYGDEGIRIERLVRAGTPPPEWS